jgi:hypothetical protein
MLMSPEVRLRQRLRDAISALDAADGLENDMSIVLRAGLQLCALELDDHLDIALLPAPVHKVRLQTVAAAIECIEIGVAQFIIATAKSDHTAMEDGLAAAQSRLNAAAKLQQDLETS